MKMMIKNSLKVLLVALMLMAVPEARNSVDAEDQPSESFDLTTYDDYEAHDFTGEHFKISSTSADEDGIYIGEGDSASITSLNGEIITKIEFKIFRGSY